MTRPSGSGPIIGPNIGPNIGIVVIGRNEGERLAACLASLPRVHRIVYVDSASSDASVAVAHGAGVAVVELDTTRPLSAARARNAGIDALSKGPSPPDYVQTIDGDCTLDGEWLAVGVAILDADPGVAVVAGRLRERHPEASIYNRLCDDEWHAADGEAAECGGVALWRFNAVMGAGLFDEALHAGEEPELCHRLRRGGFRIWRLSARMGTHDANLIGFGSWARRMFRSGFSFAQLVSHGDGDIEPTWRRELIRIMFWAVLVPMIAMGGLLTGIPWVVFASFAAWAFLVGRMALRSWQAGHSLSWAAKSSALNVVGKFWQAGGALQYHLDRYRSGARGRYSYAKRS